MKENATLRPSALTDVETARAYLGLSDESRDTALEAVINHASGAIDRRARRRLRALPYIEPFNLTGTTAQNDAKVTGISTTAAIRVGMLAVHANIPTGAWVRSVDSSSQVTLTKMATAAGSVSIQFKGQGRMELDGDGTNEQQLREYPGNELITAKWRDDSGTVASLVTTGARITGSGYLILPSDSFPVGSRNVLVECVAGFDPALHPERWDDLEHACLRLVQVYWQDQVNKIGRGTGMNVQGFGVTFIDVDMPRDVAAIVDTFRRVDT